MFSLLKKRKNGTIKQVKLEVRDKEVIISFNGHIMECLKFGQLDVIIEWKYQLTKITGLSILSLATNEQSHYLDGDGRLWVLQELISGQICFGGFNKYFRVCYSMKTRNDAEILLCENIISTQKYVVKAIKNYKFDRNSDLDSEFIYKKNIYEIGIYQKLKSQENNHIIQLESVYANQKDIYLLFGNYEGGSLFKYLSQRSSRPTIEQISTIMTQLLSGLQFLHSHGIMHRDIKLDNVLLKQKNDISSLVIIDFEYAQVVTEKPYLFTQCGTPNYMAPEIVLNEPYDEKCDVYSLGVAFHILLTGQRPKELLQIEDESLHDLLSHMLSKQKYRYSAQRCLNHAYFNGNNEYEPRIMDQMKKTLIFPSFKNPFN